MMKKVFAKRVQTLAVGLLAVFMFALTACNADPALTNRIALKDNDALLTNPHMGWNFSYYANTIYDFNNTLQAGDFLDDYPCDTVFFRIGWNWLEPKEGEFNWAFTDDIADEWIARGKKVAFCWVVTYPGDQSTPLWVKDAGAQGVQYQWLPWIKKVNEDGSYVFDDTDETLYFSANGSTIELPFWGIPQDAQEFALNKGIRNDPNYNNGEKVAVGDYENYRGSWIVDYKDPIFLAKWENFLAAAAARYDDNPSVEFIEIGSFGDWGEGHSSYTWFNRIDEEVRKTHIDLYLKYFDTAQVLVNDTAVGENLIGYARDNGLGVGDHTLQVPNGTPEGYPGNAAVLNQFYQKEPVLLENHNGTQIMENYYNSVNNCHATFARINCNPYVAQTSEWTDKITRRLGYRLTFTEIAFNDLKAGAKINFEYKIKNTGAAPCYDGGRPTFYIVDSLGRIQATAVSDLDVNSLKVGDTAESAPISTGTAYLTMPDSLLAGDYYVMVAVTVDGKDTYNLPLAHQDGERQRYKVATFTAA